MPSARRCSPATMRRCGAASPLGSLAIVYFTRGPLALHGAETGRKIERFTPFERSAHWANAIAFSILAISGLVMAFGKFFLHPVIGSTLFGWLTYALKNAHNFAGPVLSLIHISEPTRRTPISYAVF